MEVFIAQMPTRRCNQGVTFYPGVLRFFGREGVDNPFLNQIYQHNHWNFALIQVALQPILATTDLLKGALDNFSLIRWSFSKKVEIFKPLEVFNYVATACLILLATST